MKIRITPDVEKLHFDVKYESGIMASIDWIAGGNFDGYVYKKLLFFYRKDNKVTLHIKILNQERADAKVMDKIVEGVFSATDKNTITCYFEGFNMRGKVLGLKNEFIAFSVSYSNWNRHISECYLLDVESLSKNG